MSEQSPVTGETEYYGYSWDQELRLGRQADEQIQRQFGIYDDPALSDYVNSVAREVLANSDFHEADTPERYRSAEFTFRVLDSPVVNAFALPGGYVYVTRGLLTHLENEAQLAVVLGHEIAHVAARHASRQALRAQLSQVGLLAGAIVGQQVFDAPGVAENILNLGGAGLQLLLTRYSRDAERESDDLGVKYAAREGYAVGEAAGFFRSLERLGEKHGPIPTWQSTHPDPGERARTMHRLADEWQTQALTRVEQEEYLAHIEGVVVGDDPREGYVESGVFYHPELRFSFDAPGDWQLINQRQSVVMVAPENRAIMTLSLASAASPREAARELERVEGVQVARSVPTEVGGFPGHRVALLAPGQRGNIAVLAWFFSYNDRVYSFLGYAPEPDFPNWEAQIVRTVRSFDELSDRDRIDVQPARLEVIAVRERAPFRALAEDLETPLDAEALAVLNQLELDAVLETGAPLKVPRQS